MGPDLKSGMKAFMESDMEMESGTVNSVRY